MKKLVFMMIVLSLLVYAFPPFSTASGSSYAVIDAKTGRLLLGNSPHTEYPIASLTKIWTAYVATEEVDIQEETTVSPFAATQEGSSLYLKTGEKKRINTLLYGLMLRSGNDSAVVIAEHVGGSVEGFVDIMNEKAKRAGLNHTTFRNPSGLHHEEHLSTAYETALMLKLAMDNKELRKIITSASYREEGIFWENKHKLVRSNSLAIAGKTGYTKAAGRTLATFFKKGKEEVIVVTLNHSNDWVTHAQLAGQVFDTYNMVQLVEDGSYDLPGDLVVKVEKPINMLMKKKEKITHVVLLGRDHNGNRNAKWTIQIDGEIVLKKPVIIEQSQ